jgi:hypothetical protein
MKNTSSQPGQFNPTEAQLKQLFKEAIGEILEEKKDLFRQAVLEAVEDIALVKAIEDGRKTKFVSREKVLQQLRQK